MIEINLVPDVKQELLRAQRVRTAVISLAIAISLITVGCVVLLAIWVFGVQAVRNYAADQAIKDRSTKLAAVQDVNNTLTIQNQLTKLQAMHDAKPIDSRVFDLLQTVNPPAPNDVRVTSLKVSAKDSLVTIQAQAVNGYTAQEVFKKTLEATTIKYTKNNKQQTTALASSMTEGDRSYGEDANGVKVLRFTLSFKYPKELFAHTVQNLSIQAPSKTNVTDSYLGVPQSLFVQKAEDIEGTR